MKKNVLVFPCGSEIGLEVHRSLHLSTHFELYGGSSVDDHGMYVYKNYIPGLPFIDDEDFVVKLNQVIEQYKIDMIIPAHDSAVLLLAQAADQGLLTATVMTSPLEACEVARSKKRTYEVFAGIIPTPNVYAQTEVLVSDFPLFLKPDVGQGSKGTERVKSIRELEFYLQKDPTLLILEYLPGKEYTIDCFTDRNRQLQFCEGRQRNRIAGGISVNSSTVQDERFKELAEKINQTLELRGAWFFQVKERQDGEFVLMEIATRIAGTMGLVRCKGVNLVLLSLFDALEYDITLFENEDTVVIDRALENRYKHSIDYEHVYLDFDDLVIFEGKVNPQVMAFVYQCINKGVKVHLLTKHKEDLMVTFKKYRLEGVFDEIIWIASDHDKFARVTEQPAIFIDDSFAERKQMHEQRHIPVFDAHMIESLMEKF